VRPKGQLFRPLAAAGLAKRYSFHNGPRSLEELTANPTTFRHGLFDDTAIDELSIYNDGIVVGANSNTAVIDGFLDDLLEWLKVELGTVPSSETKPNRLYESVLIAKLDINAAKIAPWAAPLQKAISTAWASYDLPPTKIEPLSVRFAADPSVGGKPFPSVFTIERKNGLPFGDNVYFCQAPLRTDDHLAILDKCELLL
jgi:hypothetical protein